MKVRCRRNDSLDRKDSVGGRPRHAHRCGLALAADELSRNRRLVGSWHGTLDFLLFWRQGFFPESKLRGWTLPRSFSEGQRSLFLCVRKNLSRLTRALSTAVRGEKGRPTGRRRRARVVQTVPRGQCLAGGRERRTGSGSNYWQGRGFEARNGSFPAQWNVPFSRRHIAAATARPKISASKWFFGGASEKSALRLLWTRITATPGSPRRRRLREQCQNSGRRR